MTSKYNYAYFTKDANRWDSTTEDFWGLNDICPSLMQFHVSGITRADLSAISQAGRWENPKKQSQGMAYHLLVPSQEAEEEKRFGLAGVWVHPNQFLLSSLEEVAKKLTLLISTKEDWYYAIVQVNEGAQHPPFQHQTHQHPCRWSTQQKHLWMSQPTGGSPTTSLRQGGDIVQVTLPKLPLWEMGSTSEDTQLQINLPRTTQGVSRSSPSMVIDTGFLPALCHRVPQ